MRKLIFCIQFFIVPAVHAQLTVLKASIKITSSVKIAPGTYHLNKNSGPDTAVIEIKGNNIVVDFNNAVLEGNVAGLLPDKFSGLAINIKSGKNITIKNCTARGYKIALLAKGIEGLVIEHCDFSYNYRQHLNSTQQKEDLSDWMSYHHNEKDEWLRYGAAMYLRGCSKAVVHDNIVTGGQCALMLTQCDGGMIYNNNFSFNSGIGIGMYRSSNNKIMYNKLDFNVRGHSEGVYNRGQDAAAILVFEQCNNNVYAFNSATHSGDGFFLWAGQTTMDSGEGGCNDNLIFFNNFSYAPTNGIEVTFSRNRLSNNTIYECDNGIWAGYSYNTLIISNQISGCNTGIAIEHGQDNKIKKNQFFKCNDALKLWARSSQPANWGYAIKRDTKSRNYAVDSNLFTDNNIVFNFFSTALITGNGNTPFVNRLLIKSDSILNEGSFFSNDNNHIAYTPLNLQENEILKMKLPVHKMLFNDDVKLKGRKQIRMTEWGPYDFKSPLIWNTNPVSVSDTMQFEIIGPKGNWKLMNQRGVKIISPSTGSIPATVTAVKTNEKGQDVFIELEYKGQNITTVLGDKIAMGRPYLFNYRNALLPTEWKINWYAFDSAQNPVKNPELIASLTKQPFILTENSPDLNYAWWSGIGKEKKYEQFVTIAETDIDFPDGVYEMGVSWEDVVRIYLDGQLLLDEWRPAEHLYDESPHRELPVALAGKHHIRVEHANQGGFATLIIKLKKK